MSAGNAKIVVRPDFSGFVKAMEKLAAALEDFAEPATTLFRTIRTAHDRGGRPHGELVGACSKCRAEL